MAKYQNLKEALDSNVFQNSRGAVTGSALNSLLTEFINTIGKGSGFMGILSATNKPTTTPDGKQFYVGFNVTDTPLMVDLSAVGLSQLTITRNNLFVVHNVSGEWNATDIAQGIAAATTDNANEIAILNGKVDVLNAETFYQYQSHGLCLKASRDYIGDFPPLSIGNKVYIRYRDGKVDEVSIAEERISVSIQEEVWLLPDANKFGDMTAGVWSSVAELGAFSLFIPSGCMVYDYFLHHQWRRIGAENFGIDGDYLKTVSRLELFVTSPYYDWYNNMPHEGVSIRAYDTRDEMLRNL